MTFGFILLVAGLAALTAGIKGVSIAEVLQGVVGPDNPIFKRGQVAGASDGSAARASGPAAAGISTKGGAREIVETAAQVAAPFGTTVVSAYRAGSVTTSGNLSDHSENDASRAARDIGVNGVDALKGPPPEQLDKAIVAIGDAFGRHYKGGKPIVDTFTYKGYTVQVIWRVPSYGGHEGHIHVGAHESLVTKARRGAHRAVKR